MGNLTLQSLFLKYPFLDLKQHQLLCCTATILGVKMTLCSGSYIRNLRPENIEVLARITYLFNAVLGLKLVLLRAIYPPPLSTSKTYLRIRKLKSCDREHDFPSCNQGILWQLPCNGQFVGGNVFHLPGLRILIGVLSEEKKRLSAVSSKYF